MARKKRTETFQRMFVCFNVSSSLGQRESSVASFSGLTFGFCALGKMMKKKKTRAMRTNAKDNNSIFDQAVVSEIHFALRPRPHQASVVFPTHIADAFPKKMLSGWTSKCWCAYAHLMPLSLKISTASHTHTSLMLLLFLFSQTSGLWI